MPVTISIGVCGIADDLGDHDEFISRADQALYYSKETGRDRCSAWRPTGDATGDSPA